MRQLKRFIFFLILSSTYIFAANKRPLNKFSKLEAVTKILGIKDKLLHERIKKNLSAYQADTSRHSFQKIKKDLAELIKSLSYKPLASAIKVTKLSLISQICDYKEFHFLLLRFNLVSHLLPYLDENQRFIKDIAYSILVKIDPHEALVNLGMKPERLPKNELSSSSSSSSSILKPKKALIILAGKEAGGTRAFDFKNFEILKQALMAQGYKVKMRKATTTEEVLTLMTERKPNSYDLLMLGGHGCPVGIDFGDEILSLLTPLEKRHFDLLKEQGKIFLISCSTGKILTSAVTGKSLLATGDNICEFLSEVSDREVVAPIFPTNFHTVFVEHGDSMAFDGASSLVSIPCSSFLNGEFLGYEEDLSAKDINQFSRLYFLAENSANSLSDVLSLIEPGPYCDYETGLTVLFGILLNKENNPEELAEILTQDHRSFCLFDIFAYNDKPIQLQCLKIFRYLMMHSDVLKKFLEHGVSIDSLIECLSSNQKDILRQVIPLIYRLCQNSELKKQFLDGGLLEELSKIYFKNNDKEILKKALRVIDFLLEEGYEFPVETNLLKTKGWLMFKIKSRADWIRSLHKQDKKLHLRLRRLIKKTSIFSKF